MNLTQKATSGEQKLKTLPYNHGLKTDFHISCANLPNTTLHFAKLCVPPDFLPQPSIFLHGYVRDISKLCPADDIAIMGNVERQLASRGGQICLFFIMFIFMLNSYFQLHRVM